MNRPGLALVIIGAGGHGREVLDVIEAVNEQRSAREDHINVLGFLDDGEPNSELLASYAVAHLGGVEHLASLPEAVQYLIGIGSPGVRRRIDQYCQSLGRQAATVIHPSATVGRQVDLGPGTVVCAHSSLTNHISLGRHVHVNRHCTVGHDATLADYVTLSPKVALSGNVTAGEGSFLGTGSNVNPGLTIGQWAVVGSGATVVRSVDPHTTVVGVPARVLS